MPVATPPDRARPPAASPSANTPSQKDPAMRMNWVVVSKAVLVAVRASEQANPTERGRPGLVGPRVRYKLDGCPA